MLTIYINHEEEGGIANVHEATKSHFEFIAQNKTTREECHLGGSGE
jgi:hypothetical protein